MLIKAQTWHEVCFSIRFGEDVEIPDRHPLEILAWIVGRSRDSDLTLNPFWIDDMKVSDG